MTRQLRELRSAIIRARCAPGGVTDGTRCNDVQAELLHLSLSGMPAGPEKQKLLAIPTGLTIAREDVDLLIKAGHDAVTSSTELKDFLAGYPPNSASARARLRTARQSTERQE